MAKPRAEPHFHFIFSQSVVVSNQRNLWGLRACLLYDQWPMVNNDDHLEVVSLKEKLESIISIMIITIIIIFIIINRWWAWRRSLRVWWSWTRLWARSGQRFWRNARHWWDDSSVFASACICISICIFIYKTSVRKWWWRWKCNDNDDDEDDDNGNQWINGA